MVQQFGHILKMLNSDWDPNLMAYIQYQMLTDPQIISLQNQYIQNLQKSTMMDANILQTPQQQSYAQSLEPVQRRALNSQHQISQHLQQKHRKGAISTPNLTVKSSQSPKAQDFGFQSSFDATLKKTRNFSPPKRREHMYIDIPIQGAKQDVEDAKDEKFRKNNTQTISTMQQTPVKRSDYLRKQSYSPPVTSSKLRHLDRSATKKPRARLAVFKRKDRFQSADIGSQTDRKDKAPRYKPPSKNTTVESGFNEDSAEAIQAHEAHAHITQLNEKIQKLKRKNQVASHIRKEVEIKHTQMDSKIYSFENEKQRHIQAIEDETQLEIKKIRMYASYCEKVSNKKVNADIEGLKRTIYALKQDLSTRDKMNKQEIETLNKSINSYQQKSQQIEGKMSRTMTPNYEKQNINKQSNVPTIIQEKVRPDGKIHRVFSDGHKEVIFTNGSRRQIFPDGRKTVFFANGDTKETFTDGKSVYKFSEAQITQTNYGNGLMVLKFANGQVEKHYPDKSKEVHFTNGTIKRVFANGVQKCIFPDGYVQTTNQKKGKQVSFDFGNQGVIKLGGFKKT